MFNCGYFVYDIAVSRATSHPHAHFWPVHYFEFQYKCITEKWFCRFISDQDKNITSFVARNIQGNFILNQGNLGKNSLKIAVYLTFPYPIPYKISLVFLPETTVRMTYPSHPRKTRNTPSCTSAYPYNIWYNLR